MNVARKDHSSCALGRSVYVFCGTTHGHFESLNSIEMLNSLRNPTHWKLIPAPRATLAPRYQAAVSVINDNQIAILGGWSKESAQRHGDVVLFDTQQYSFEKVVTDGGPVSFNAQANQCGRTQNNTVVALVSDGAHIPSIVQYKVGENQVRLLAQFDRCTPNQRISSKTN